MVKTAPTPTVQPTASTVDTEALLAAVTLTDDVIEYTIACALALSPPELRAELRQYMALHASKQARRVFGGDRVYIAIRAGEGHSSRNAAIKRDYLAGEHLNLLERRYGIKRSRLWEIIKS
jgi:Mor family transcriptional regulator